MHSSCETLIDPYEMNSAPFIPRNAGRSGIAQHEEKQSDHSWCRIVGDAHNSHQVLVVTRTGVRGLVSPSTNDLQPPPGLAQLPTRSPTRVPAMLVDVPPKIAIEPAMTRAASAIRDASLRDGCAPEASPCVLLAMSATFKTT